MSMSKGVRIYFHEPGPDGLTVRECYNATVGISEVYWNETDSKLKRLAVGTEEGAMVVHYMEPR